jgi:hypothetical protein
VEPEAGSRWFLVNADWDYRQTRSRTLAYKAGRYGYGTRHAIEAGLAAGKITPLAGRPPGWKVDKAGRVVRDGD